MSYVQLCWTEFDPKPISDCEGYCNPYFVAGTWLFCFFSGRSFNKSDLNQCFLGSVVSMDETNIRVRNCYNFITRGSDIVSVTTSYIGTIYSYKYRKLYSVSEDNPALLTLRILL